MERDSFSAKRRAARSSTHFHIFLALSAFFCFALLWRSRRDRSHLAVLRPDPPFVYSSYFPSDTPANQRVLKAIDHDADMPQLPDSMPLRIITYNIRYETQQQVADEKPWRVRRPRICTQMRFMTEGHESPFLCLQEALHAQVHDVQAELGSSWAFIGRGRGKGEADDEYSPIFYRPDTWKCLRSQVRWLSPTPEVPSRGWDAAQNRIVTMGDFLHNTTGTRVIVLNTHFDHVGTRARAESAKLLIRFAKEWSSAGVGHGGGNNSSSHGGEPQENSTRTGPASTTASSPPSAVLVAGDFNSQPDDEGYKIMTASGSGMTDMAQLVPKERRYGNELTYTSFGEPNEYPQLIDFLFIQDPRTATVKSYGVLDNRFDDHRPVVADLDIQK